jgi:hypothetical protein
LAHRRNRHNQRSRVQQNEKPPINSEDPAVVSNQGQHPANEPEGQNKEPISEKVLVERIKRSDRWMIALTAVIAGGGLISAIIFGWQLSVMQAQLNEAKFENRPWVGLEKIQSDTVVEAGKPFKISVFVKNFGHNPAPKVKGCIASDTPNIYERDSAGIAKMMNELSHCQNPISAVLMPSGDFSFDVSRRAELTNTKVAADINRGYATFAAFGRLDYEDAGGVKYWTTFCALYVQGTPNFNACAYGNEAH